MAAAKDAREYVSIVETVATAVSMAGKTPLQQREFESALLSAYRVDSLNKLSGRVGVFLLTDIRVENPNLNCYQFGCESLDEDLTPDEDSAPSAIKVALVIYVFHLVETKRLSFSQSVNGKGLIDLVVAMIGESDNQAANDILNLVGMPNVNTYFAGLSFAREELPLGRAFSSRDSVVS